MLQSLKNIYNLGVKEIISLFRDWLMVILIVYSFSLAVVTSSRAQPDSINHAAIAVVDEDHSQLSRALSDAFMPPMFIPAKHISRREIDPAMDRGEYTFVVVFPPDFQRDVLAGKRPEIQVNVDATRMTQAFNGSGYIQQILQQELLKFRKQKSVSAAADYVVRNRFNPNLTQSWFTSIVQLVNNVTMLAIILTGAALIRERENGTLEHLLVMPVTPFEIMMSKVWSMMLVVLAATAGSLYFVIEMYLKIPIEGSIPLFLAGVALHLFAVTSLGIFLACIAQNMPQLGMLLILVFLPMQMLSGGNTPRESMPVWVQNIMLAAPTTHFVSFSQSILFRGAGIEVVWKPFLMLFIIGSLLFVISLRSFRKTL
ncbi:MAG: ABC transporter permease [Lentisphaeria bacterium]|nr:ABC transporter permease [Lentisphaeria bacterium]